MIYFHFCQTYKNSTTSDIDKAVKRVLLEYTNRDSLKGIGKISSFTGGIYVFKIKTPYAEIIFEEQKINFNNNDLTIYFIRGFKDGLQDYVEIRDGKWGEYNKLPQQEIEDFKATLNLKQQTKENKMPPPNELLNWQNGYKLKVEYDIYESEAWVKFAMDNSPSNGMKEDEVKLYRLVLIEIFKEEKHINLEVIDVKENEEILALELNEVGIIFSKIKVDNRVIYLLHNGANTKKQTTHWEEAKNKQRNRQGSFKTIKDISIVALKAYPHWAIKEADMWAKIEKNNEMGNLSLLPEQTEFLKDFKFPKYINGQAGSGKSTMLYYLFANAYYYKYAGEIKGDIVFLTENEKLLGHTKKSVYDLLLFNPEFELSYEDIAITNVDKHFYSFKKFLLEFLPEENLNFLPNKYLNFSKFKYLYGQSNIANHIKHKFSAEYTWFTISTYVFGYDLNYHITSENYETKMPSKGKEIISLEDLKTIEKEILKPFYEKLLNDGYWDKIKLIKYLNENIEIQKQYEVIFCDEAQDFSKVELEFILKMSSYTKYDLKNVPQFPIVFAGDALQTVNPIGFRTEVLTSMLYNELLQLGFNLVDKKPFEPTYNYRSSQTIVNLSNAIQFYRKVNLGAEINYPQTSKRPVLFEYEHLNVFVDFTTFNNDEKLQKKVEFKTIIVPVNNDEIEDFKKSHPILNSFDNILSAVDAKGIDFSEVVIFGFGEFINNKKLGAYEAQFFFNKLYVAITRAQVELVIIDSDSAKNSFWIPIIKSYLDSSWLKAENLSLNKLEDIIIFDSKQIIQSSSSIIEDDALRQKEQGIIEKNIPLLQVASSHFIKIGNRKEYYLCLAEIEEIKENWKRAAEFYLNKEVGEIGLEKAAFAFWNGQLWEGLLKLNQEIKTEKQQIRFFISKIFTQSNLILTEIKFLSDKSAVLKKILDKTVWRNDVINKLLDFLNNSIDIENTTLLAEILENICDKKDVNIWECLGKKYFELNRFEASINAFERIGNEGELFIKSKLEIAKRKNEIEDIIIWLGRLAIETSEDKLAISSEIIHFSNGNNLSNCKNIYVNQYIYFAYLLQNPGYSGIIELSQKVEKLFEKREVELADSYRSLLIVRNINPAIQNFLIERWAKNSIAGGVPVDDFNSDYKNIALKKGLKFEPFTELEILKLPVLPTKLISEFPSHFTNIQIKKFRKFKDLKIEDLGLFNLVVGDNNIGKTSILEGLLFIPNKREYIQRLAFAYIERTNIIPDKDKDSKDISLYYNLKKEFVCDFYNCDDNKSNIEFTITEKRNFWNYIIEFDEKVDVLKQDNIFQIESSDYELLNHIPYLNNLKQPFIAYGKGFSSDLAQIYLDEIGTKRKEEEEFIKRMSMFIRNIQRIIPDTKNGTIEIRDTDFPEDMPLHQYGEGANKLFRILVLLTLHKGKKLLIDEIDAGIHYSRFKLFWSIILRVAMKDNTQIIATTHNDECIKYFTEVLNELGESYQNVSRVVQMKIVKDIKVHSYKFESFNLAVEDGFEIRGGETA
jgi:AAA15 family ATPase/GTPase